MQSQSQEACLHSMLPLGLAFKSNDHSMGSPVCRDSPAEVLYAQCREDCLNLVSIVRAHGLHESPRVSLAALRQGQSTAALAWQWPGNVQMWAAGNIATAPMITPVPETRLAATCSLLETTSEMQPPMKVGQGSDGAVLQVNRQSWLPLTW